jgi:hypothetical protein
MRTMRTTTLHRHIEGCISKQWNSDESLDYNSGYTKAMELLKLLHGTFKNVNLGNLVSDCKQGIFYASNQEDYGEFQKGYVFAMSDIAAWITVSHKKEYFDYVSEYAC